MTEKAVIIEAVFDGEEQSTTEHAIDQTLPIDSGGIIAVDANGNLQTLHNTPIMARGQAGREGLFRVTLADWSE